MLKNPRQSPSPLHDKSLGEIRDTRNIHKHNKINIQQANSQHQAGEKLKVIPLKSGRIQRTSPVSPYLLNVVLEVLARAITQQNKIKSIQISKEEGKLVLVAEDMIIYTSDPKNSTKELLQMINTFIHVAGIKINSKNQ